MSYKFIFHVLRNKVKTTITVELKNICFDETSAYNYAWDMLSVEIQNNVYNCDMYILEKNVFELIS